METFIIGYFAITGILAHGIFFAMLANGIVPW